MTEERTVTERTVMKGAAMKFQQISHLNFCIENLALKILKFIKSTNVCI